MKRILLIVFCIIVTYSTSHATTNVINCDSLGQVIHTIFTTDQLDHQETAELAPPLYEQTKKGKCDCRIEAMNLQGFVFYNQHQLVNAKKVLLEAEALLQKGEGNATTYATNQLFLGLVYVQANDYESAIYYFEQCKQKHVEIGDEKGIADASLNMGVTYLDIGDFDKAEEKLLEAYKVSQSTSAAFISGYAVQNLVRVYLHNKHFDKAIEYANKAIEIWEAETFPKGLYYTHIILSDVYKEKKTSDAQVRHLQEALRFANEAGILVERSTLYNKLAQAYETSKQFQLSKEFYKKALDYGFSFDNDEMKSVVTNLIRLHAKDEEYDKITDIYDLLLQNYQENQALQQIETEERISKAISLATQIDENQSLKKSNEEITYKIKGRNVTLLLLLLLILFIAYTAYRFYKEGRVRKGLLQKIKQQNIELSGINKELTHSKAIITEQNQTLASKNKELKNFAYVASHDLKAPARTIQSFASLLKKKIQKNPNTELLELVDYIEKGGKNMNELISDLLTYAKLEKDNLQFRTVAVSRLLEDVCLGLQQQIQEKKAQIEVGNLPTHIYADKLKLKQVFQNLISNAIKFSNDNSKPHIHIFATETNEHFKFYIKDNGIGIAPEYHDQIFQMFRRLHAASEYEGTGIGLATCAKAIQLHQGNITVQSNEGQGSTFSFTISKRLS